MKPNKYYTHYSAFISYRHKKTDRQIARILHFLLEHNWIRPDRKTSRKIRPVFLDEAELPTSQDLNEGIRRALEHSDSLFVICSPDLPLSKYCMEEIRYFKQLHGGSIKQIHPLLISGEPAESFPEHLWTTIHEETGPDGTVQRQVVDAEPLSADIRGRSLAHSLFRLLRSEYIRLLAAHFDCPFDKLYKRYLRWCVKVAVCLLAAVFLGIFSFRAYTGSMVDNSIAGKAEEALLVNDPLSALTVCMDTPRGKTQRYETALRSAVVQYDYQKNALPISSTLLNRYPEISSLSRYLSKDGRQIILQSSAFSGANRILQITDTGTGQVLLREPQERFFVIGESPERYLTLRSHPDGNGTMMDYVSLMDLRDNSLIREFAYRESSRASAGYELQQGIENKNLLAVMDGKEYVTFLTQEGIQLPEEEFARMALESLDAPLPEDTSPYRLSRSRRKYLLKDAAGQELLSLDYNSVTAYDFSQDYTTFAWAEDGLVHIYDLKTRQEIASSVYPQKESSKLTLLENCSYYAVMYLEDDIQKTVIYDWNTGDVLLKLDAFPLFDTQEQIFYTTEDGSILRFDYNPLDLSATAAVMQHSRSHALLLGDSRVTLLELASGEPVLQLDTPRAGETCWDADLGHILVPLSDRVCCYDRSGALLWEKPVRAVCFALSEDGALAAWYSEDGTITVSDSAAGQERWHIDAEAPDTVQGIAVSPQGVCVCREEETCFYPQTGACAIQTDAYSHPRLTADGLLTLSDDTARVRDFVIYDTASGRQLIQPDTNTEKWVYSPASGYLIRHAETSGNSAAFSLEILKRKGSKFDSVGQLPLTHNLVQKLHLDGTGQWLSFTCSGRTQVYLLPGMEKWLDAAGELYYENGSLYRYTAYGNTLYHYTPEAPEALRAAAQEILTGGWGIRTLTQEEQEQLTITQ